MQCKPSILKSDVFFQLSSLPNTDCELSSDFQRGMGFLGLHMQ